MMSPLFLRLLILFNNNTSNRSPIRLEKKRESFMDRHFETILKALFLVLIVLLILLIGTVFVILITNGSSITGTEANGYYYHLEDWV